MGKKLKEYLSSTACSLLYERGYEDRSREKGKSRAISDDSTRGQGIEGIDVLVQLRDIVARVMV